MSKTQKYRVISPLLHDGKKYQPGDEVALTEDEAAPLLAVNVVEAPSPALEKTEAEGGDADQAAETTAQKGKKGGKGK